jgi:hypothetical protein
LHYQLLAKARIFYLNLEQTLLQLLSSNPPFFEKEDFKSILQTTYQKLPKTIEEYWKDYETEEEREEDKEDFVYNRNITNTSKNKVSRSLGGFDTNGAGRVVLYSGLYLSTVAINQIQIATDGNLVAGTRCDLYGITTSQVTGA